jgi:hypothetical protein
VVEYHNPRLWLRQLRNQRWLTLRPKQNRPNQKCPNPKCSLLHPTSKLNRQSKKPLNRRIALRRSRALKSENGFMTTVEQA